MRALFTIILFIATTTLFAQSKQTDVSAVQWLVGEWTHTNAKPGRSGVEIWSKISQAELKGSGISLRGSDTTFVEKLRIITKDGGLFYAADVPENKGEVLFRITELKDESFVCENPQHDFPKKITYTLTGTQLRVIVSGGDKSIEYLFVRK